MKRKKITLHDIAIAAGVSQMTVSRAIHGKGGLRPELQEKILQLAETFGYVPSRSVKELHLAGESLTVGVVVPHFANTIFPEIIENIESGLAANGYRILLCCSYNNPIKEFREISALLERRIDGIIWCPVQREDNHAMVQMIRNQKCPFVFLDRLLPGVAADAVVVDDRDGMAGLVKHLLGRNVRRFAYLDARLDSYTAYERFRGFRETLAEAGIPVSPEACLRVGSDLAAGRGGCAELLALPERPEAIVCFNDPLAIGVELELRHRRIAIPAEIAITGFSGVIETELCAVPLTTAYQNAAALGTAASRLLLSRMRNPADRVTPVCKVIKTVLKFRESTRRKLN